MFLTCWLAVKPSSERRVCHLVSIGVAVDDADGALQPRVLQGGRQRLGRVPQVQAECGQPRLVQQRLVAACQGENETQSGQEHGDTLADTRSKWQREGTASYCCSCSSCPCAQIQLPLQHARQRHQPLGLLPAVQSSTGFFLQPWIGSSCLALQDGAFSLQHCISLQAGRPYPLLRAAAPSSPRVHSTAGLPTPSRCTPSAPRCTPCPHHTCESIPESFTRMVFSSPSQRPRDSVILCAGQATCTLALGRLILCVSLPLPHQAVFGDSQKVHTLPGTAPHFSRSSWPRLTSPLRRPMHVLRASPRWLLCAPVEGRQHAGHPTQLASGGRRVIGRCSSLAMCSQQLQLGG
jgi:hypothetical protein